MNDEPPAKALDPWWRDILPQPATRTRKVLGFILPGLLLYTVLAWRMDIPPPWQFRERDPWWDLLFFHSLLLITAVGGAGMIMWIILYPLAWSIPRMLLHARFDATPRREGTVRLLTGLLGLAVAAVPLALMIATREREDLLLLSLVLMLVFVLALAWSAVSITLGLGILLFRSRTLAAAATAYLFVTLFLAALAWWLW